MKLTLQLKLLPTAGQKADLLATMARFNEAATFAAKGGFEAGVFGQFSLHKIAYKEIREKFGLTSNMAIRAIAKAVECFQRDKTKCPVFKPRSALIYNQRIMSFKGLTEVSLWALSGRLRIPFVCGDYQRARQGRIKGEADLVYRQGKFFLLCTIDLLEGTPDEVKDFLGVDMGIVNLSTDSDGNVAGGELVQVVRRRRLEARVSFQKTGTKSAKRRLKAMAHKEANFRRNENHRIAKGLVRLAKGTARGIGLEDLKHIRERTTVRRKDRARHSGWGFAQLQAFVTYKAKLAGVPVIVVDARNTSRMCSECGHTAKANRKTRDRFECLQCGFSCDADLNAARNIRDRATVKWSDLAANDDPGLKSRAS